MKTIITLAAVSLVSCNPKKSEATTQTPTPTEPVAPAAQVATDAKPYPLETCLVSGEKLGEMGKPHEIIYQGQQIKFCCKSCVPKFEKEPATYLSKLK